MKKTSLLSLFSFFIFSVVFGQIEIEQEDKFLNKEKRCGITAAMEVLKAIDPVGFDANKTQSEKKIKDWIAHNYNKNTTNTVITIPIVFQIWETTSSVPDIRVMQQLQRLNEDFRGTNLDRANVPNVFPTADCEIEFCLAIEDPQGNSTTGIIRKNAGGKPAEIGGTDLWDPTKYLNVFVYSNLRVSGIEALGLAYLPSQFPNNAVHIRSLAFGNTSGAYNLGRTTTHEVGHWLNLEHIWGDAICGNDFCNDTPPQRSNNFGCPSHPSNIGSCSGNTSGEMFMNYMDYVDDVCMGAFTPDQKTRMIAAINMYRTGLLTSTGCGVISSNNELLKELEQTSIYPNPSNGTINIEFNSKSDVIISVFNIIGDEVYSNKVNKQNILVDMNNQPNGVYMVMIKLDNTVITRKVMLAR